MVRSSRGSSGHPAVVSLLAAALTLSATLIARADGPLEVRAESGQSFAQLIRELQTDVQSEGRVFGVQALDANGQPLPCARYRLDPTVVAREAFVFGACNEATMATQVTLAHRSSLFGHNGFVPEPRVVTLAAALIPVPLRICTADVRPSVPDLEHGTRVQLTPARFDVRSDADVTVTAADDHWTLRRNARDDGSAQFQVVDRLRGQTLVTDSATLTCGAIASDPAPGGSTTDVTAAGASTTQNATSSAGAGLPTESAEEVAARDRHNERRASVITTGLSSILIFFLIGGAVIYGVADNNMPITADLLIWDTVICGGGMVLGGLIALIGALIPPARPPTARSAGGPRIRGVAVSPTGGGNGAIAAATFAF